MPRGRNKFAYSNGDGRLVPMGVKHNDKDASGESGWNTFLDLILILVPTAILMIFCRNHGKPDFSVRLIVREHIFCGATCSNDNFHGLRKAPFLKSS